jgi:hypothetical protein
VRAGLVGDHIRPRIDLPAFVRRSNSGNISAVLLGNQPIPTTVEAALAIIASVERVGALSK